MKRVISIVLLLLTLFTNSFVKASLHYCGETITQFAFGNEAADPCDCAETGNMDCCKDIVLKAKPFSETIRTSNFHIAPLTFNLLFLSKSGVFLTLKTPKLNFNQPAFTGPPPLPIQQVPAFLSVYRI